MIISHKKRLDAMEIWKPLSNYPGYEASNYGNVRSWIFKGGKRKKALNLKPINIYGYYKLSLRINGESKPKRIHRLVLEAFVGRCPEGLQCGHNNGIRTDNRLENLRWDTPESNQADRKKHGTATVGEKHPMAKLTNIQVTEIKMRLKNKEACKSISKDFPVSPSSISNIKKGKVWKS